MSYRAVDSDVSAFGNGVPPPPYPGAVGVSNYDLTPTPQDQNRPRLPEDKRNSCLENLPEDVTIVKFQTIVREQREIVVGRIKVPTPGDSHAFILRRYDTNAISLTTMFKVAFPGATEEEERCEVEWVKSSYDTRNTNGGRDCTAVRLAGQWVSRHLAIHLGPAYGISDLVNALARAVPDPNVAYRKSQRSQAAAEENTQPVLAPVPALTLAAPIAAPVPKRQRRQDSVTGAAAGPEERRLTLEATTTVTAPVGARVDMEAEIAAAKQLVMDLKRELRLRAAAGEDLEDQGYEVGENVRGVKRGQGDDEGVVISAGAVDRTRVVKKNKRVEQNGVGEVAKKAAWGVAIFGMGVGFAAFLPHLASSFF